MSACLLTQPVAANDPCASVMLKCVVTVILRNGVRYRYPGIFRSTADAVGDACERHVPEIVMTTAMVLP